MSPPRPARLVVVTGTATGVGKTWVAAATARALRARGLVVAARKPVQSFGPDDDPTDAAVLAAATGEAVATVCPPHRSYGAPLAPPMAADVLGRPAFTIADLVAELTWPVGVDVGLVEGAGGPRSPLAADGDTLDLVRALGPDRVVLVGDAGLGTINAVRLAVDALRAAGAGSPVVALNRLDPALDLHARNRDWLAGRAALDVVTTPAELAERLAPA